MFSTYQLPCFTWFSTCQLLQYNGIYNTNLQTNSADIGCSSVQCYSYEENYPDSKIHGANMGPTCVLSVPGGSHVGPMNFAFWICLSRQISRKINVKLLATAIMLPWFDAFACYKITQTRRWIYVRSRAFRHQAIILTYAEKIQRDLKHALLIKIPLKHKCLAWKLFGNKTAFNVWGDHQLCLTSYIFMIFYVTT